MKELLGVRYERQSPVAHIKSGVTLPRITPLLKNKTAVAYLYGPATAILQPPG